MAEEDLIFGKNRHLFGGIEPSNMKKFQVYYLNSEARIEVELPNDTVIDGQTLCTVAGAIIRKKTDGYPINEFDGILVSDVTTSGTITDSDVDISDTWYYAAFPYSAQGVYNRNKANRFLFSFIDEHYIFGYDLDISNPDPNERVTYPSGLSNSGYTPAHMDYATDTFDYGDWPSTAGEKFMPKPCILKYNGTVSQYVYPDDYSKQCTYVNGNPVIGSNSSSVGTPGSGGNAMMEWPKIYTHREVINGVYKFRCSDIKIASDWDCWCNYDNDGNEIDHFYTGIYLGLYNINSSYNDRIRSISGYMPLTSSNSGGLYNKINYAKTNGVNWYTEVISDRLLIQDLLVMMANTTDCKTAYGTGVSSRPLPNNGTLNNKGLFYGSATSVKVFGMEHYWGDVNRLVSGVLMSSGTMKMKFTRSKHDGTTCTDYDSGSYDYNTVFDDYNYVGTYPNQSIGYIKEMNYIDQGCYPFNLTGSSNLYYTEYSKLYGYIDDYPQAITFGCGEGKNYYNNSQNNSSESVYYGPFSCCALDTYPHDISSENNKYYELTISCKPSAS